MEAKHLKISLRDGISMEMVYVAGGEFLMGAGSSKHEHKVQVSSFYLGAYPVTQGLWQAVMGDNPSRFRGENRPVETVSWNDARNFFQALNKMGSVQDFLRNEVGTSVGFRLPTEAEWEYAARGGAKSRGFLYSGSDKLAEVGWFDDNSYGETKPVGLKQANELGLFDMSGNVWEWCGDWYGEDYYKRCAAKGLVIDPQGPDMGYDHPGYRYDSLGFRLAVPCQSVG